MGILPTIGKTLKINGRIRRYVVQDYLISVPLGKRDLLESGPVSKKWYAVAATLISR